MADKESEIINNISEMRPDSAQPEDGEIVLAADYLPEVIPLLPVTQRPAFPGMLLPVILPPGPYAEAASAAASSEYKAVGIVLTKEATTPESMSKPPELFDYGTAAKILKSQKTEENSIQLLLTTLKRFRIRKMLKDAPQFVAAVQYFEEPKPEDDEETSALTLGILGFPNSRTRLVGRRKMPNSLLL